jgi:DNA replication and repair protein RecF
MIIKSFKADGFRNLQDIEMIFDPQLNVLCGKNAQGKTNILEAVWLCSGERSFRGAKDRDLLNVSKDSFSLRLEFRDKRREQTVFYGLNRSEMKNKKLELNGVNVKTTSGLFGAFECVIFTPEDLELSKGSPDNRRQFIDLSVSQIKTSYRKVVDKYKRLLEQRNMQLKQIASGRSDSSMLEIWDMQLAQMGAYISMLRYNYCKKLKMTAASLYSEISCGTEELDIVYHSTVFDTLEDRNDYKNDLAEEYFSKLEASRDDDIRSGFTAKGVHRDDIYCYINGMYAKDFASQGQHRSVALILKLAQAYILAEEKDDAPCILLDDVLSELDNARQGFVMNKIKDMQVLITCCDEDMISSGIGGRGKLFHIDSGKITQ